MMVLAARDAVAQPKCPGDLNGDGRVTIDDILRSVNYALDGCPMRFVDNGDGSISDNWTGLMWEKKIKLDGTADYANLHDADNYYLWANRCSSNTSKLCQPSAAAAAACAAGVEGDATVCARCTSSDGTCTYSGGETTIWEWLASLNAANFAGHADWRISKRGELEAIVDYADTTSPVINVAFQGASCGARCADITNPACACTRSDNYWSASAIAHDTTYAWFVDFNTGFVNWYFKDRDFYVRAVRGGL
jgi:hypothetical protein